MPAELELLALHRGRRVPPTRASADRRPTPLERRALDDAVDERRHPVVVLRRVSDDRADRRHVVVLDPAAERVGHQALGEAQDDRVLVLAAARRAGWPARRSCVPSYSTPTGSTGHFVVLDAPRAGRVVVLERQAERVDHAVARVARRVLAVLLHALAHRQRPAAAGRLHLVELGHVGRRRRRRAAEQHFHHPLAAIHRRRAIGVRRQHQDAAVAENAAAVLGQRHAAELRPGDVRNAVVQRHALVDERVVGREQVEQAPILAHEAVEEELGLALERLRRGGRRTAGTAGSRG